MSTLTVSFKMEELAVIWELLRKVRLGDRNKYETVVSKFMIDLEKAEMEDILNTFYFKHKIKPPEFMVESSNDGFVINVN